MTLTDETLVLRAIDTEASSGGNGGEYKPWPVPDEDPDAAPTVITLGAALNKPLEGVVLATSSDEDEDTGTHALPAVKRLTGEPSAAVDLHRTAARIQRAMAHLGVAVWYGEHTKEFWVMDATGLHSFDSVTGLYQGMGWQAL